MCFTSSFESTFAFTFFLYLFFFELRTFELTGLPSLLVVMPCPKTRSFIIKRALFTSYFVSSPLSRLIFRTVFDDKVLFVLPSCPLTKREGFSMELFGEQNKSTKTVCTASRVEAVIVIHRRERELVSLSLGFI